MNFLTRSLINELNQNINFAMLYLIVYIIYQTLIEYVMNAFQIKSMHFNTYLWCLHNGLFSGKLGLIRLFRYHIPVVCWTLFCLRLIPEKCRDFLNQYLDIVIVHMLKIRDKSLLKIRIANCIHCATACRCLLSSISLR